MATVTGTKCQLGIQPKSIPFGVVAVESEYVALGTEAAGTVIQMIRPEVGQRVLQSWLSTDAQGAGVTLAVGDTASTARYIAATAATTALAPTGLTSAVALGRTVLAADSTTGTIDILTAGATLTAAAVIRLVVLFAVDG